MNEAEDQQRRAVSGRSRLLLRWTFGIVAGLLLIWNGYQINKYDPFMGPEPMSAYSLAPFCIVAGILIAAVPPGQAAALAAPVAAGGALTLWALGSAGWPGGNDGGGFCWLFAILPRTFGASLIVGIHGVLNLMKCGRRVRLVSGALYGAALIVPIAVVAMSIILITLEGFLR
jgi:hypothetical protein